MAKGQKRSTREIRKPKQANKTKTAAAVSPFATPPGKSGSPGGGKRK